MEGKIPSRKSIVSLLRNFFMVFFFFFQYEMSIIIALFQLILYAGVLTGEIILTYAIGRFS